MWSPQIGQQSTMSAESATTGGAWMLALSPLMTLGLVALGWWLTEGGTTMSTVFIVGGLWAFSLIVILIATISDYRRLGVLGHDHRASVAWILIGPSLYLLVRAVHVHRTLRSGTAPTWVYFVLTFVVGAVLSTLALFIPREAGITELSAVEAQIAADMQAQGLDYTMICPSQASVAVGSSFVCTAYDEVGPVALVRVTWSALGEYTYEVE